MLLNEYATKKAFKDYEGEDTNERTQAILKQITEEFVKIRDEVEKEEVEKKASEVKKDKLIKALKEYDSSLSESDLDRIARYVDKKPTSYRTYLKYPDDTDFSSLLSHSFLSGLI